MWDTPQNKRTGALKVKLIVWSPTQGPAHSRCSINALMNGDAPPRQLLLQWLRTMPAEACLGQGGQGTLLRRRSLALQDKVDVTRQWKGKAFGERGTVLAKAEGQEARRVDRAYGKTVERI